MSSAPFPLDVTDELLSTTRAVRRRLDLARPVEREVLLDCIRLSQQAPTGSNSQTWHWIVLTDPEIKQKVADLYAKSFAAYSANQPRRDDTARRVASSAQYLADTMAQVPVLVIGAIYSGGELPEGNQAGLWGSLLPGAWSLQLALRARGLGSAWTTLHLVYEKEVAEILGIPDNVHQGVLLPVAYYTGTDFKPAGRKPLEDILHVNGW